VQKKYTQNGENWGMALLRGSDKRGKHKGDETRAIKRSEGK
jgi:hypothetical protein